MENLNLSEHRLSTWMFIDILLFLYEDSITNHERRHERPHLNRNQLHCRGYDNIIVIRNPKEWTHYIHDNGDEQIIILFDWCFAWNKSIHYKHVGCWMIMAIWKEIKLNPHMIYFRFRKKYWEETKNKRLKSIKTKHRRKEKKKKTPTTQILINNN